MELTTVTAMVYTGSLGDGSVPPVPASQRSGALTPGVQGLRIWDSASALWSICLPLQVTHIWTTTAMTAMVYAGSLGD